MSGLVYYLTALGLADGHLAVEEKRLIQAHIRRLLEQQAAEQMLFVPDEERRRAVDERAAEQDAAIAQIEQGILERWSESITSGGSQNNFVREYLEVRCFEVLQGFDPADREVVLAVVDSYLADGHPHPAERELRDRVVASFRDEPERPPSVVIDMPPPVTVVPQVQPPADVLPTPFFEEIEFSYSADPDLMAQQLAADSLWVQAAMEHLQRKRACGAGRLDGSTSIFDFQGSAEFLDGHVHVVPPARDRDYELTVLGDLHGCYSCLKAALLQSRFFERIEAFERSPAAHPEPRLILLGDYVDRGRYSFDGVLRCALKLLLTYPRYVYLLRGNHEWYRLVDGRVMPAVWPAEGYSLLRTANAWHHAEEYRQLFEALPHFLFFDQMLFVHGGAPPDDTLAAQDDGMASLNDPDLRMLALWGDPSPAEFIPVSMQHPKAMRFSYGRAQLQRFLESTGCHTLVRGHENVRSGFLSHYESGSIRAFTLFSAGGATNNDLRPRASYRKVTPMALTVRFRNGQFELNPWPIDYATFNRAETNGFYSPVA